MERVEEVTKKKRSREDGRDSVQGTGHGCRILQEGRVCVRLPSLRSPVCVCVCVCGLQLPHRRTEAVG